MPGNTEVAEALADLERPAGTIEARVRVAGVQLSERLDVEHVGVLALLGPPAARNEAREMVSSASPL